MSTLLPLILTNEEFISNSLFLNFIYSLLATLLALNRAVPSPFKKIPRSVPPSASIPLRSPISKYPLSVPSILILSLANYICLSVEEICKSPEPAFKSNVSVVISISEAVMCKSPTST